jgi:hypothetical protein
MLNKKEDVSQASQRFLALGLLTLFIIIPVVSLIANGFVTVLEVKAKDRMAAFELPQELLNEKPKTFPELEYKALYDIELSKEYLTELQDSYIALEYAICPNEYTPRAIESMNNELIRLKEIIVKIEADIETYTRWKEEFPYMSETYMFLRRNGYSDIVACGIIGNMMVETGGNIDFENQIWCKDLRPLVYSEYIKPGQYFGLCQWSIKYNPSIVTKSFEEQLDFLLDTLEYEFNVFGYLYKDGFEYEDFKNMSATDDDVIAKKIATSEAAYAFAKAYERCASWSCGLRRGPSVKAYEYFVEGRQI